MATPSQTEWATLWADQGATVTPTEDGNLVDMTIGYRHAQLRLRRRYRNLRPSEVSKADDRWRNTLLVRPHISRPVAAQLGRIRISNAAQDGAAHLFFPDGTEASTQEHSRSANQYQRAPRQVGERSWAVGKSRVVHALLVTQHDTIPSQTRLAKQANGNPWLFGRRTHR